MRYSKVQNDPSIFSSNVMSLNAVCTGVHIPIQTGCTLFRAESLKYQKTQVTKLGYLRVWESKEDMLQKRLACLKTPLKFKEYPLWTEITIVF